MKRNTETVFWDRVERVDGCWRWRGTIGDEGYGIFSYRGKDRKAHRIAYEFSVGPIPQGLCVLHHCDNRSCVNSEHLFVGTNDDNVADRVKKGRSASSVGTDNANCKLTERDVAEIRRLRSAGVGIVSLSERFGVTNPHISQICLRRQWNHL